MTRSITTKDIQQPKLTHSCCANRLQSLPHSMVVSSGGAVSCWHTEHHWTPGTSNYPAIQSCIQAPLGQQGNWSHAGGKRTADTLDRCYSKKAGSHNDEVNRRMHRGGTLLLPRTVVRLSFSWTGFPWPSRGSRNSMCGVRSPLRCLQEKSVFCLSDPNCVTPSIGPIPLETLKVPSAVSKSSGRLQHVGR